MSKAVQEAASPVQWWEGFQSADRLDATKHWTRLEGLGRAWTDQDRASRSPRATRTSGSPCWPASNPRRAWARAPPLIPMAAKSKHTAGKTRSTTEQELTVQQAANLVKKDRKTVADWLTKGLPSHKRSDGTTVLYPSDLRRFARHSKPQGMAALQLDPESKLDREAFTRGLEQLGLLEQRRLSDAQLDQLRAIIEASTGGEAGPPGASQSDANTGELEKRCQAALDEYHAKRHGPRDLPDWFWTTAAADRFSPPTNHFRFDVLTVEQSSLPRYRSFERRTLKVRRSSGFVSVDEPPYFRREEARVFDLAPVRTQAEINVQLEMLERENDRYRAAEAQWAFHRSSHRSP